MQILYDRLKRERHTIQVMIELYCHHHHQSPGALCSECQELLSYAERRIERCPFQANKPTCAKCSVHCYKSDKRQQVRHVMRYAGPRMMLRHPILALWHLFDEMVAPKLVSEKS